MSVSNTAGASRVKISVVIPTYNEASSIVDTLMPLQRFRQNGDIEVILSDGNSTDATRQMATGLVDRCINESKGRALQMNSGAKFANGQLLLFLHADTQLPVDFVVSLGELLTSPKSQLVWGFFPLRLSGNDRLLRIVERCISLRSRLTSIATGDQAIFVNRALWQRLEGYGDIALMEDVEFSGRARKLTKAQVQSSCVVTSSRRWEQRGIVATVLLMWRLRWLYFCGVSPQTLAKLYR